MTNEQKKAIAIAQARMRASQAAQATSMPGSKKDNSRVAMGAGPDYQAGNPDAEYPVSNVAQKENMGGEPYKRQFSTYSPMVQSMSLGGADEVAAGVFGTMGALGNRITGNGPTNISENIQQERARQARDAALYQEENPKSDVAGQIMGALLFAPGGKNIISGGGGALTRLTGGPGRIGQATRVGLTGSGVGGAQGFMGTDGDLSDRASGAGWGAGMGAAIGTATPGLVRIAGKALTPIMAKLDPDSAVRRVINTLLQRGETSPQKISDELTAAGADGQQVYAVVDALGNPGQRALSNITRTPNNARMPTVQQLDQRQAGMGRRVTTALSDGFEAPDTATQRAAGLKAERTTTANANYGAAEAAAKAVDVSPAIQAADDFLKPGANSVVSMGADVPNDSIRGAVARAKRYLTDGKSQVSDYSAALQAKQEIDGMIESASPSVQRQLIPVRNALDDALATASEPYAAARNAFRAQSKGMEAVEIGKKAATRGRSEDTIAKFSAMTPEEQAGFRAGYVDPLIEATQGAAVGVNKARPLLNDATLAEFPAFAQPGKADPLIRKLNREMTMFETRNAAMGGSKTADNLSDGADSFDPSIIGNLLTGNIGTAGANAARTYGAALFKGQPAGVQERLAKVLMETDPIIAQAELQKAVDAVKGSDAKKRIVDLMLAIQGGQAGGLLAASPQ